jgi:hypothetical protein
MEEAVKRLSPEFRAAHPEVPWSQIGGMRDVLIHGYDRVDFDRVWSAIERPLPEVLAALGPLSSHRRREWSAAMDQEPLVTEQIEAGQRFIEEFESRYPVQAAFWLKATEDSFWYLYVVSDRITDENFDVAYGEVLRLSQRMKYPNFDPFRVNVIGVENPLAKAALEIYRRYPEGVPARAGVGMFGLRGAEGVYLYPPPAAAVRNWSRSCPPVVAIHRRTTRCPRSANPPMPPQRKPRGLQPCLPAIARSNRGRVIE